MEAILLRNFLITPRRQIGKMCKRVQAKKGEVLTTPEMLEECKMKPRHRKKKQKQKNPKNYQRNVIKI